MKLRRREVALEAVVEEQARRIQELEAALAALYRAPEAQERRLRALQVATAKAAESLAAADQVSGGLLHEARRLLELPEPPSAARLCLILELSSPRFDAALKDVREENLPALG